MCSSLLISYLMEDIVEDAGALWSWKRILSSYLPSWFVLLEWLLFGWDMAFAVAANAGAIGTGGAWDTWFWGYTPGYNFLDMQNRSLIFLYFIRL